MSEALPAALGVLGRRLDPMSHAPVAVAFSGGGDSLALLLAARAFAERCGRPLVALHVDHRLQPASAAWADGAERAAERLGARFERLSWIGDKPEAGVPAAAREARHRLVADAARALGAPVVLVGHTLDDQLENVLMRGSGVRMGVLGEWSPSPVWPQGRGLFLCRPLLNLRRADLRRWLADEGLTWLDDPANEDLRHPRARARRALAEGCEPPTPDAGRPQDWAGLWRAEAWGGVVIDRQRLTRADAGQALRLLQATAVCVSGAERLSRPGRAEGLLARLAAGRAFVASLGGARIEAGPDHVALEREAGEAARGGLAPLTLRAGAPTVWDGRFEMVAQQPGLGVEALRGQGARLEPCDRAALSGVPAAARPSLPLWRNLDDDGASPRLALAIPRAHLEYNGVRCRALGGERLAAAAGVVTREAEIGTNARMANAGLPSYVGTGSKD
ncbi:MAG TPA: tRNA lysidine(34) synthetase TilS [Caulobacteraceae bacterium]|jgi:tRNA(Ile)-lysidine synthase